VFRASGSTKSPTRECPAPRRSGPSPAPPQTGWPPPPGHNQPRRNSALVFVHRLGHQRLLRWAGVTVRVGWIAQHDDASNRVRAVLDVGQAGTREQWPSPAAPPNQSRAGQNQPAAPAQAAASGRACSCVADDAPVFCRMCRTCSKKRSSLHCNPEGWRCSPSMDANCCSIRFLRAVGSQHRVAQGPQPQFLPPFPGRQDDLAQGLALAWTVSMESVDPGPEPKAPLVADARSPPPRR